MAVRETILEEADRLTRADRAGSYGPALPQAERFATIASAVTGCDIKPEHFPLLMIAVKLSRESYGHKRDNLVDIAGYARVAEKICDEMPVDG
jgi:hypothetical protein